MNNYSEKSLDRKIIAILLIAAAIRTIFLIDYYNSPFWNHLLVDSLFHHRWALILANGNWIGQEAFFRAPFYIYILGAIGEDIWLCNRHSIDLSDISTITQTI